MYVHALINATCAGTQGSIDNPLTFDVGLIHSVSYQSVHLIIKYMQHFSQIVGGFAL